MINYYGLLEIRSNQLTWSLIVTKSTVNKGEKHNYSLQNLKKKHTKIEKNTLLNPILFQISASSKNATISQIKDGIYHQRRRKCKTITASTTKNLPRLAGKRDRDRYKISLEKIFFRSTRIPGWKRDHLMQVQRGCNNVGYQVSSVSPNAKAASLLIIRTAKRNALFSSKNANISELRRLSHGLPGKGWPCKAYYRDVHLSATGANCTCNLQLSIKSIEAVWRSSDTGSQTNKPNQSTWK